MKCVDCPFHLACFMGRLGYPYEIRLCPKCGCLNFTVDREVVNPDYTVDVKYGRLPMGTQKRQQGHVVHFRCEKRVLTSLFKAMHADAMERRLDELKGATAPLDPRLKMSPVVVNVTDPGPGNQAIFQIGKCMRCSGQFARAAEYFEITPYDLDKEKDLKKYEAVFREVR